MSLVSELQRRSVFKVGAAYLVVAWLTIQAASIMFPTFEAPAWALRVFIFVLMLGFPVALVLAWMFDVTPEGLKVEPAKQGSARIYAFAGAMVALAMAWFWFGQPTYKSDDPQTQEGPPSIAVLPFANLSSDAEQEYFSDGMTEELLNVLAKNPALKVAARTSVFEFKGKGGDVRAIGKQLGVSHIVEGSIRRDGQQIRVTAQLIRVADGFHVWSETYDRKLESVFALQDDIAKRIGEQLQASLGVSPPKTTHAARAEIPPAAYEAYLKARGLYRQRKDMLKAIALFEDTVQQAPQFAAGWSSLSLTYEVVRGYTTAPERVGLGDVEAKCRDAALRANALDPDAAMTLHAMGNVARMEFRYAEAERLFERAMAVDPTYPDVREDHSELLSIVGRDQEAFQTAEQLVALEPFVRNFWSRYYNAALALDRVEDVRMAMARITAIDQDYNDGVAGELFLHIVWGRVEEARAALAAAVAKAPSVMAEDQALFAWATRAPDADEAKVRRIIEDPLTASPAEYMALRGDADMLFAYYGNPNDTNRQWRRFTYNTLSRGAARRFLADPRAKALLREYGHEAYWREKGWPALCRPLPTTSGADDFECGDLTAPTPNKAP